MQELTSLESAIETAQSPLEKAAALNALAWELRNSDNHRIKCLADEALQLCNDHEPQSKDEQFWLLQKARALLTLSIHNSQTDQFRFSLSLSQDALAIFEQAKDEKGLADTFNQMGNIHFRLADYAKALSYYHQSLALYEKHSDRTRQFRLLNNIGTVYSVLAAYDQAIAHLQNSLTIAELISDLFGQALSHHSIGNVYYALADYDQALTHLTKGLAIAETINNLTYQAASHQNLANVYGKRHDYDQAMMHYQKCLTIAEIIGDQHSQAASYYGIGSICNECAEYEKALDNLSKSHALFKSLGLRLGQVTTLIAFGEVFTKLRRFDKADAHLQKALFDCHELRLKKERFVVLQHLAELYSEMGDFARAYDFYKQFHQTKEEVFNQEQQQKLTRLQIVFETEQAKKEAEQERVRNAELSKVNDALREANRIKTEFLGIAAHDLKNPLAAIRGFSELIMLNPKDFIESHEMAEAIYNQSNHMLKLIRSLLGTVALESETLTLNNRMLDTVELTHSVVHAQLQAAKQKSQTIHLEAQPSCFVNADDLYLRQILDNLISNAIKYSPAEKSIWVRVKKYKWLTHKPPNTCRTVSQRLHRSIMCELKFGMKDKG
jgi:signal transduction histidine kinase